MNIPCTIRAKSDNSVYVVVHRASGSDGVYGTLYSTFNDSERDFHVGSGSSFRVAGYTFNFTHAVPGVPDFAQPIDKLWVPKPHKLYKTLVNLPRTYRERIRAEMRRLAKDGQPVWANDWFFDPFDKVFTPHEFGHPSLCEDISDDASLYMTMMWLEALGHQYPEQTEKLIDISLNGY